MSSLNNLLHPHHVSLVRLPHTLQSLFHSFADRVDPYFEYDRMPSHKKVVAPRFNVTETEASYILDGEIPGVADKSSVSVMWLQNQVLMISGTIVPSDTETASDPFATGELRNTLPPPTEHEPTPRPDRAKVEVEAETPKPAVHYPRRLLEERRLGPFHRSFTFPDEVDADNMKANLKDGLLRIVVPKTSTSSPPDKRIAVQ